MLELTAKTEAGARLVALAETLAEELARRAPRSTTARRSFPHASVDALKRAGYFTAPIPAEYGGLGVTSVHDVVVASSRLARGDASVAIGVNMHLVIVLNIVRRWQAAVARRRPAARRRVRRVAGTRSRATASSWPPRSASSARTSPGRRTTATRTADRLADRRPQGVLHGSPAATVLNTAVTFTDDDGVERYGYVGPGRTRPASRSTATGTRSACAPRAATR